jgi:MraZ protein
MVPAKLRAYAKLETNVTIAGVRDHMEIWNQVTWNAYQERLEDEEKHIPF